MNVTFENKTVVITGAAGGLGKAMAERFAADGARVALCDLRGAEDAAAEIGGNARGYSFDITDREAVASFMKQIAEDMNGIDVLVNNAGINVGPDERKTVDSFSDKWWDAILKVDLDGTYNCTKAALAYMKEGGSVVNISSIVGMIPLRNQCAFTAAKAGVINFTKTFSKEYGKKKIRCNAVAPGFIKTKMTEVLSQEAKDAMAKMIPLQELGEPEDVAKAIRFLASDEASYITGQTLAVSGGMAF